MIFKGEFLLIIFLQSKRSPLFVSFMNWASSNLVSLKEFSVSSRATVVNWADAHAFMIEQWFIPIMSVMLPIMIIEAIAGGYLGYQIYLRAKKVKD